MTNLHIGALIFMLMVLITFGIDWKKDVKKDHKKQ